MQPRVIEVLEDIRESIGYIAEDTAGMTYATFVADRRARQLVARNFEIIGETINRPRHGEPAIFEQISSPNQYVALRNVLIHRYDVIEDSTTCQIVETHVPTLQ